MTPENRELSPYTGWTRAHWEAAADRTLAAVRPYASPGHALIDLPGPVSSSGRRSDGLEGFARTFLTAGFRLAQSSDGSLAGWYARGLAAGTDPASPERWPRVTEVNQAKVEAASIALALHESRHVLWDALDDGVRERVVAWLAGTIGQPYPRCNWLWFQNITQAFLRSVGGPWSAEEIERNIATMEEWYLGDGWYTDGPARKFDWYAGWAMNFYPLWYCRMTGEPDAELLSGHRDRLREYLTGVQHLYAPDGAPLHQGRSLTYRYAALAPVWAGAVFGTGPLSPGRTRRLASGVLRHFAARVPDPQPVGWYGEFEPIRQPYTGAGSPYWSGKGFAGLVLPADHPVWTDVEEPLAVEEGDVHVTLPVPGWLVSATTADGIVRVANHGADHAADGTLLTDDPHYSRHAYSTHAGPWNDGSLVDGHVALVDALGRPSHRRPLEPVEIRGRVAVSRHRAHWPVGDPPGKSWPPRQPGFRTGPWLTTASVLNGAVEVRLARVDDAVEDVPFTLRIGGYAVAADERPAVSVDGATAGVHRADGLVSTVTGLLGLPVAGVVESHGADAYGAHSAVPVVATGAPVRPGEVYAAAVVLAGVPGPPALPVVTVSDDRVVVRWPDGTEDRLRLPTRPVFAEDPQGASMHRPL